mgnify:CR=1 FL=1
MSIMKGSDVVACAISLARNHHATYRLRTCGVDRAAINNVIAENMRRHLGVMQNLVTERGHPLSHVECWVETRFRSRSRREKMTNELASDSTYVLW